MLQVTLGDASASTAQTINIPVEPYTETKCGRRRITATTNADITSLPSPCKVQIEATVSTVGQMDLPKFSTTYEPTPQAAKEQWVQINQATDPYVIQLKLVKKEALTDASLPTGISKIVITMSDMVVAKLPKANLPHANSASPPSPSSTLSPNGAHSRAGAESNSYPTKVLTQVSPGMSFTSDMERLIYI